MSKEFLVPLDVETTGLDPNDGHLLLEISAYVMNPVYPFDVIEPNGFHAVIKQDKEHAQSLANDFVLDMHSQTGLWDKLENGKDVSIVDSEFKAYLETFMNKREGRIMGNSIRLDMNFLDKYLPESASFLHYRSLDVSGLSYFAYTNFDIPYYEKDESNKHSADADIRECIKELKHVHEGLSG